VLEDIELGRRLAFTSIVGLPFCDARYKLRTQNSFDAQKIDISVFEPGGLELNFRNDPRGAIDWLCSDAAHNKFSFELDYEKTCPVVE
jgi:hypothetical protein